MLIQRRFTRFHPGPTAWVILCLVLLSGCDRAGEPLLRVGTNVWSGYEPLYLARELKFFAEPQIRLVEMPSTTVVMNALRDGSIEVAALTLDEALSMAADGFDLRVILVMDVSNGADTLVTRPEIAELKDLKGKRVGYEAGAVGAVMLDGVLSAAGLGVADITQVQLPVNQQYQAFTRGRVDAVITFEPITSQLKQQGGRVLFDSSHIPGRIIDVLAVPAQVIQSHPKALATLVQAQFQAVDAFARDPLAASRIMAPRAGQTAQEMLDSFEGLILPDAEQNRAYFAGSPPRLQAAAENLAKLLLAARLISREVAVAPLLDGRFVGESAP